MISLSRIILSLGRLKLYQSTSLPGECLPCLCPQNRRTKRCGKTKEAKPVGIVKQSICTTEPTLLEVIKWLSKVHYAHIQLDDEVTSNIVYWAMKSRTGSVDAYPIPCNPQLQLQQTNHSQDLWHQVDLPVHRYRVNHIIFYTSH